MSELTIPVLGILLVLLVGWASGVLMMKSYFALHPGSLKKIMMWLAMGVLFFGVPYALWLFLIELKFVQTTNNFLLVMPGVLLMLSFFIFVFKASLIASNIGDTFGFKSEVDTIKKEMKKK